MVPNDLLARCPAERFPDVATAAAELLARRARSALGGTTRADLYAYPCDACAGAHLARQQQERRAA